MISVRGKQFIENVSKDKNETKSGNKTTTKTFITFIEKTT